MLVQNSLRASTIHHASTQRRGLVASVRTRAYDPETLPSSYGQSEPTPPVGSRVEQWLKTPFDIAAFGPRTAAGVLFTIPDRLATLQTDVQKAVELLQDPRPLEEKKKVLLQEVEDTFITLLERGVTVESEVLASIKTILPPDAVEYLNDLVPEAPNAQGATRPWGTSAPMDNTYDVTPGSPAPAVTTYYQADVLANQLASQLTEIKSAVTSLKGALESVRANSDVTRAAMLRLSLREARDLLARRLAEVSPATSSEPSVNAAAREARILLDEVDAQFFV